MPVGGDQFTVAVDGVGDFTFKRRTIRLNISISVDQARLTEGVEVDDWLAAFIEAMAALRILTIEAPKGWDLDALDAYDEESYDTVVSVWSALRDKEKTFRKEPPAVVSEPGPAPSADDRVLVPEEVSPPPDGSPLP